MQLPIAERWFETQRIDDDIICLWEPHVIEAMRSNIWHVRGRDRDLFIDTGMGIASLSDATRHLVGKSVIAVATHTHDDHIGSHHEFAECWVHSAEAESLACARPVTSLLAEHYFGPDRMQRLCEAGYEVKPGPIISALPHAGFDLHHFTPQPAKATRVLDAGDIVDTGDRAFEVLHLPGHSPGSIGLWEAASGTLFSGDALYDGPLLDKIKSANIPDYMNTMRRLRELPVRIVHAGHEPSFGRARMIELIDAYLRSRNAL